MWANIAKFAVTGFAEKDPFELTTLIGDRTSTVPGPIGSPGMKNGGDRHRTWRSGLSPEYRRPLAGRQRFRNLDVGQTNL